MKSLLKSIMYSRRLENPIYSAEIEKRFNVNGSVVRDTIRELRREGFPIANSKKGYYLARDKDELADTIEDLKCRSMSMLVTIKALEQAFEVKEPVLF